MSKYSSGKLSLTLYDKTVSIEWPYNDLDIETLFDSFIGLLVTQTFELETIREYIKDYAKELNEVEDLKKLDDIDSE